MDDINKLIQERDNLLKTTRHIEEQLHTINKMIELKKTEVQNSSEPKNYLEVRYLTKATSSSEKGMSLERLPYSFLLDKLGFNN